MSLGSKLSLRPFLRVTLFSGLLLLLLISGILFGILAIKGGSIARGGEQDSPFHRLLREYDFNSKRIFETELPQSQYQEFDDLDRALDRLEKRAEGVESWLSVLKRRRQLTAYSGQYEDAYRNSSQRAALAFPHSEPIAAVAAAALVYNTAITREGEAQLREILPLLINPPFISMRLSLHVLLGDFAHPEQAMASLPVDTGLPIDFTAPDLAQTAVDLVMVKVLAGDIPGVAVDIQPALSGEAAPALTRFAAEYFYDFGNPTRSAALFSVLSDEKSLGRQADALWLAGYPDNARTIWTMIAAAPDSPASRDRQVVRNRALYNLAATARTPEESAALFEQLAGQAGESDTGRQFGVIRFSRLLDTEKALAVLEAEHGAAAADSPAYILIGLEILRRRTEIRETARVIAEIWLLLEQYPEAEEVYQWGAWYMDVHRNYNEGELLLKTAARNNIGGQRMSLHAAIQDIRGGSLDTAERILAAIPATGAQWAAAANLGRVLETRRVPTRALESYEKALEAITEMESGEGGDIIASRIQVRMAHCLKSLRKDDESRRALEYALELNPDNLSARLELSRL